MKRFLFIVLIAYSIDGLRNAYATPIISPFVPYFITVSLSTLATWKWQAYQLKRSKINQQRELEDSARASSNIKSNIKIDTDEIKGILAKYGEEAYGRYREPFKDIGPIISGYLEEPDTSEEDTSEKDKSEDSSALEPEQKASSQLLTQKQARLQKFDCVLHASLEVMLAAILSYGSHNYNYDTRKRDAQSVMESFRSLGEVNEEAGHITPLMERYFINPFQSINTTHEQHMAKNRIDRKYQKKRRKQQKFLTSSTYTIMRYVVLPLCLCIGISSFLRDDQAIPRSADPFWRTMVYASGLCCAVAEIPTYLLRYRVRKHRENKSAFMTATHMLSKYRVRQGFLDLVCGLGTLCTLRLYADLAESPSSHSSNGEYVVGGWLGVTWFALHAAHGLAHI